jgi:N-acetylglucosamine kinase-like BadF-type ATPase
MPVVLGVDGGGTKTHALVTDEAGRVLGSSIFGPSNWEDIGVIAAGETVRATVLEALAEAGAKPEDVAGGVIGLAGLDWESDRIRLMSVPDSLRLTGPIDVVNDAFVALRAGASRPYGVVVIAGSGAIAAGRNIEGEVFRTLGLGQVFGDFGSATDVSLEGVRAVAEAFTGKGPATELSEALLERTGVASVSELLEATSRGRINNEGFAPVVIEVAERGDAVARGILEAAGATVAGSAIAVIRRLRMEGDEFDLVLAGGMFHGTSSILQSSLEATVTAVAPRVRPVRLETAPVVGAVLLAMELIGVHVGDDLQPQLARDAISIFHLRAK